MPARSIKVWNASSSQWEDVAVAAPDISGLVTGDGVTEVVALTQAEYDALTPSATTLYIITD